MSKSIKNIRFSQHSLEQCSFRGTTQDEISKAISTSEWSKAELERLECRKDFDFNREWNRKFYRTKQVRPIFIEKENEIVVITVYVYYF